MTNRQSLPKRGAGNPTRLLVVSQCGLALLIMCGCAAPVTVDRPAPFERVAANAKRIFRGPIAPLESNSVSSPQPSDLRGDQVSTSIGSPGVPAIVSPENVNRSLHQNSDLQATLMNDPAEPEPIQPWTDYLQNEVVQAQYQEPQGRTFSNPSPHQGVQHQQQHSAPYRQMYGSQSYDPYPQPYQQRMRQQALRQRSGQIPNGHQSTAATSHFANQPVLHGPAATNGIPNHNFSNQEPWNRGGTSLEPTVSPNEAPGPSIPTNQGTDSMGAFGTGHLSNGMQLDGTMLRTSDRTATEIALEYMDKNHQLQEKLKAANLKSDNLAEEIKTQASTLTDKNEQLAKANQLAAMMREKIAQLNVKIQDLEQEKIVIQQDADKALKEIEATLENMLVDTLSQSKQ